MCDFECDDYAEVFNHAWPRARVKHRCCICDSAIAPGNVYLRFFMVHDGDVTNEKACAVCGTLWRSFINAHGGGYQPSMLVQSLWDCIGDDGSVGPWGAGYFDSLEHSKAVRAVLRAFDGQWRTYLAIVKQRQRASKRTDGKAAA